MGDRVAIVGVGYSTVGRDTGLTYKELAAQSAIAAMADAGMTAADIDGITSCALGEPDPSGEPYQTAISDRMISYMLGINPVNWYSNPTGNFGDLTMHAIAAVRAGLCHTALVVHPCRTFKRKRPGAAPPAAGSAPMRVPGDYQFSQPFGMPSTPGMIAGLAMQRHMQLYGTTFEQFAEHAVTKRFHASLNDDVLFGTPLTVEEYLESRWVARPVRLLDCDYPCDMSGAVIITTEERASNWKKKPVFVEAAAIAGAQTTWEYLDDIIENSQQPCADALWSRTDLRPDDVDVAQLYDGFSIICFSWLEALGFCKRGEAGPFIADGNTRLDGSLPLNTDGGVPNVGRRHGTSHCIEAVRQLRGECGERQVPNAEVGMYTVAHGPSSTAVLLTSS